LADPDPHPGPADSDPDPYPFQPNVKINTFFQKIFVPVFYAYFCRLTLKEFVQSEYAYEDPTIKQHFEGFST
jgi:hypothetical protein